jgi:hypothetical protein
MFSLTAPGILSAYSAPPLHNQNAMEGLETQLKLFQLTESHNWFQM